jgi:hypothetical protein
MPARGSARQPRLQLLGWHNPLRVMRGPVPGIHVLKSAGPQDVDGRDKPGHDAETSDVSEKNYSAGVFGLGFAKVRFRLSHSSILAPFLCMITLCCSTESELFQAQ